MTFDELIIEAQQTDAKVFGDVKDEELFQYLLGEIQELRDAEQYSFNQIEEWGDCMFVMMAFARQKQIDPKQALSMTITKLRDRRKQSMENGTKY